MTAVELESLLLAGGPWAMSRDYLAGLLEAVRSPQFEALVAREGKAMRGSKLTNHNGRAVIDVRGPLFRYDSFWTWLLGGTSVKETALNLHAALDDPGVHSIVLSVNSPGGQVDGINELADMIRKANATKPVTAYVGGQAASAAYWLAASAGKIVADETALLGSIGVLATVMDDSKAYEKHGVKRYEIVSTQSPLKRTDPSTDEGRAQVQTMVDSLAAIFIDKVASFRGVTADRVTADFGQGGVKGARAAVEVGMADALGSLEDQLRDPKDDRALHFGIVAATTPNPNTPGAKKDDEDDCDCPPGTDPDECECEEDDEEEAEGESSEPQGGGDLKQPTAERQRIAAILTCEEARGREELARKLALETDHTAEAARQLLAAAPVAPKTNGFEDRMSQVQNPKVGVPVEAANDDTPAAEVSRILNFVPKDRRRQVQ